MNAQEQKHISRKVTAQKLVHGLLWVSLIVYPLLMWLLVEYFNYKGLMPDVVFRERLAIQLVEFRSQMLFGVLVVYIVFILCLFLVQRPWIATLTTGAVVLLCGYINYMKLRLNGAPFMPLDCTLIGTSRELMSYVVISIPRVFYLGILLVVFWSAILFFARLRLPGHWYHYSMACVVGATLLTAVYTDSTLSTRVLNRYGMDIFDNVLQTSNYTANGFVGGFTVNLLSMHLNVPKDYSEKTIDDILSGYSGIETAKEAEPFDVIVVLAESFFDVRELEGVSFSEELLTNYDEMRQEENCYSGKIYTIAIGGGTVSTESRVLNGLNTDYLLPSGATPYIYMNHDVDGYVSNYNRADYNTIALHLYNPAFYSRNRAFPYMGFDNFYSLQDVEENPNIVVSYTRGYATDVSTEEAIEYYLEQASQNGKPTFLYCATIENHQPFNENEDNTVAVTADALTDEQRLALTTYAQGVKDEDAMLGRLKEYIDGRENPTVLVWFGDHLPTLYETNAPYYALGYYDASAATENLMKKFSTPFLVYSNRTLEAGLFSSKSDNQISDIYLMECVAEATGFQQTPYMQYLADTLNTLPICNSELNMQNQLTAQQLEIQNAWKLIAYDRIVGKRYSCFQ